MAVSQLVVGMDLASLSSPDVTMVVIYPSTSSTFEILRLMSFEGVHARMERQQREMLANMVIDFRKVKKAARVKHGPVPFRKYPVRS